MQFTDISIEFLVNNYLFGVPLEDQYGNKMANELLDHYIRAAIQYAQRVFQITIEPVDIVHEVHDYYAGDMNSWGFMQSHKKPIISVSELGMYMGAKKMFNIPLDWIRVYSIPGQLQLFPVAGSTGGLIMTQNGSYFPMIMNVYSNAPSMWRMSYRAGMDDVPEDLVEFIMKRASIGILQVWGDLIIGAGIANQTISLDGLSQSIGTTQSPEFTGAGARIKSYADDLKVLEARLRDTYVGVNLGII